MDNEMKDVKSDAELEMFDKIDKLEKKIFECFDKCIELLEDYDSKKNILKKLCASLYNRAGLSKYKKGHMPFGKYKNKSFEEVIKFDKQYSEWVIRTRIFRDEMEGKSFSDLFENIYNSN